MKMDMVDCDLSPEIQTTTLLVWPGQFALRPLYNPIYLGPQQVVGSGIKEC